MMLLCILKDMTADIKAEHRPLWHLTGAAHIEGLDHSTEPTGCHGDDVLPVSVHLCFHDDLRVQQGGKLWCGARVVNLPLFEKQRGYLAAGGGRRRILPVPVQLCGDEHEPLIQGVPQQLQWLQRDRQEVRGTRDQREKRREWSMKTLQGRSDSDLQGVYRFYKASIKVLAPF